MYLPSDGFSGMSPEKKVATMMRTFFTFAACRIILAQLEGSGRGSVAAYNRADYDDLADMLHNERMTDGDAWLLLLLQRNRMLGLRVMEVREAYSNEDFEWDSCERVAKADVKAANRDLLRTFAATSLESSMGLPGAAKPDENFS